MHKSKAYFVLCLIPENALDENWLQALEVDTPEKLMRINVAMIYDVAKLFPNL